MLAPPTLATWLSSRSKLVEIQILHQSSHENENPVSCVCNSSKRSNEYTDFSKYKNVLWKFGSLPEARWEIIPLSCALDHFLSLQSWKRLPQLLRRLDTWVLSPFFSVYRCIANWGSRCWFSCQLLWNHPHSQRHFQPPDLHWWWFEGTANKTGSVGGHHVETVVHRIRLVRTCSCVWGHWALNWVKYVQWNSCSSVARLNANLCVHRNVNANVLQEL